MSNPITDPLPKTATAIDNAGDRSDSSSDSELYTDWLSGFALDHIVWRVPYSWLYDPPSWLAKNFTMVRGGKSLDRKTESNFIVFKPGSYIELLAFRHDLEQRNGGTRYSDFGYGFVDWAITSPDPNDFNSESLNEELKDVHWKVQYEKPKVADFIAPDGTKIEMIAGYPAKDHGTMYGGAPFFCYDKTPRHLRIPNDEESTTHACGAIGIISDIGICDITCTDEDIRGVYARILNVELEGETRHEAFFMLREPNGMDTVQVSIDDIDNGHYVKEAVAQVYIAKAKRRHGDAVCKLAKVTFRLPPTVAPPKKLIRHQYQRDAELRFSKESCKVLIDKGVAKYRL